MMRRIQFAIAAAALLLVTPLAARAQARVVTGTVTSNLDGKPVAGASVRLKGAVLSTVTDLTGRYRLDIPAGSADVLLFMHPEHDAVEKELAGASQFDVVLLSRMRINQYGVKTERKPVSGEERSGFLVFESPNQDYKFWFDVRVQTDAAVFFGKTPAPIGNGIALRRLRFATKSQFTPRWYGELDLNFADAAVEIEDAYLMYTNKDFYVKIGNAKEVFSMETNTTSRYLSFIERPLGTKALVPSRRLGVSAAKSLPMGLRAFGGVYFQDIGESDAVVARQDNNEAFGRDEGYSLTGKLIFRPSFNHEDGGLHLAAASSYRTPKTDDVLGTMRFSARGVTYINRKKYVDTDRMKNVDDAVLNGLEGSAFYKNWRVSAEYNNVTVNRLDTLKSAKFDGAYVMASVLLFGGRQRYNSEEGEFTQPKRGKTWGDVELAARFEYLDLNDFDAGIKGGAGQATVIGANWWVNNNVKFMLNYGILDYDRYATGRGKFAIGYKADGTPTNNPQLITAAKGKGGNDFRVLALRCEVNF
ncbi:MAG: carboxypeptidase regulatory-like domain-containing protein [Gemmatimonadetes bacterium]|nr:carboxypeptidase regulatory-like domain-containing protein [Gemmatimonadota bacterium]